MQSLDQALRSDQSRAALAIIDREVMNWRTAVRWAITDGKRKIAAELGDTFSRFLERCGRLSEYNVWVRVLRNAISQVNFTEESAAYEREHAWTLSIQGDMQGAVSKLESLIQRLTHTVEFDPTFQLATATAMLGRVLNSGSAHALAFPILQKSVSMWEQLVEHTCGQSLDLLLKTPGHDLASTEHGNLSAAMGDLANAIFKFGPPEDALKLAEIALQIDMGRGNHHAIANSQGQCASILMAENRHREADSRYELARVAAREAGDEVLEGSLFQHQGILAIERNQLELATHCFQQALQRFGMQSSGNVGHIMRTYNLLGVVEQKASRHPEARTWYEKSREMARRIKDTISFSGALRNLAIALQL